MHKKAAYRALISGQLIGLDTCPGVRPLGVGETWILMLANCVLVVIVVKAKEASGTENICGGLVMRIEGGTYAVWLLWQKHTQEEDWGFLVIDARNASNEENRTAILWEVWVEWPKGARFAFNCYSHWATLVIRAGDGKGQFLFNKEVVTQGYPLEMVAYGLGILPLIRELRQDHPGVTQPWYADDAEAGGTFEGIQRHLDDLMVKGPPQGYFTEPTRSILVPQADAFFQGYGLQIVTGSRYLGGFVGAKEVQDHWMGEKVEGYQDLVATLDGVVCRHPQTAYTGLQKSLKQEWAFVQHVTPDIGMDFQVLKDALQETLLTDLFQGDFGPYT